MKINRDRLLSDLMDFTMQSSGVVVGSPGVGKTYLLKKLSQELKKSRTPHLLLPIDKLGDGTEESLQSELSYRGDLIEKLKSIPTYSANAILLFDAFDAARNEEAQRRYLLLIRRAIHELKDLWNVVVTVRTYDAKKSQELLDLFGNPRDADLAKYRSSDISCRHFTIPQLSKNEILQAFEQIPNFANIYKAGSVEFRKILGNPFNLWLLEKILKASPEAPDFSQIYSEVQLLDLFWRRRIEAAGNEATRHFVLSKVARQMVRERLLSVRQEDVFDSVSIDSITIQAAWNELLSDEILAQVSSSGQRIAFSHNIIFDYAISRLLIDEQPGQLEAFVLEDPSRPLFLRPSLSYFFTRLWYYSPELFWDSFWRVFPSDHSVQLRLFARLIPTSVIANEGRKMSQVESLLEKLNIGEQIAVEAIVRLLQACRMLKVERDAFWIEFFDHVSKDIHADFVWDMATLTADILQRASETNNPRIVATCGRIGRRALRWVLCERENNVGNDWYNRFAGTCAVPLVVNTYGTNVEKSRGLLRGVLELTRQPNFPINPLMRLAMDIDKVWPHDPEFVLLIYSMVFTHYETSEETTELPLSGPVLPLASTRRQDYQSCQYRLIKHFPKFLRSNPFIATKAGIRSLNYFIVASHIARNDNKGVTIEDLTKTFTFCGKFAYIVEDHSYIWDAGKYQDESIEMADELFRFIEELAVSEDTLSLLDSLLVIFGEEVRVAFFWKRLLNTGTKYPVVFAPRIRELCIAKPLLLSDATIYELCLFLQKAAPAFSPEQLLGIENTIMALPQEADDENLRRDTLERRRDRLMARIPLDLVRSEEGKSIRERMNRTGKIPENEPLFTFEARSEPFSEEQWLQEQGVDTTSPKNRQLQRFYERIEDFTSEWRNRSDGPSENTVSVILPVLKEVYACLKGTVGADKEVVDSTWNKLATCAAILSRVAHESQDDIYFFCRELLLRCARHELPKPDPSYDAKFDFPAYSPLPRHEAAHGLTRLLTKGSDPEILDEIEKLADDPVPSVRMVLATGLSAVYVTSPLGYWRIVENLAESETNGVVLDHVYLSLFQVLAEEREEEEKTTRLMNVMLRRSLGGTGSFEPSDSFTNMLMFLAISRESAWACDTLRGIFLKDPVRFAKFLTQAVHYTSKYLNPINLTSAVARRKAEQAIVWLEEIVRVATNGVRELCATCEGRWSKESEEKIRDTYTVIDRAIMHLYLNVAHRSDDPETEDEEITDEMRCIFYRKITPLMVLVVNFAQSRNGVMFAPTAHQFMELLTSFLKCDPREVLRLAASVARSSQQTGFNLDSLAVAEVVKFVEIVLADHRSEVREGQALEDLLNLLDIFSEVGWSEALRVVWRLDEVFR